MTDDPRDIREDRLELLERRIEAIEEGAVQIRKNVHRMTNYMQSLLLRLDEHVKRTEDEIKLLRGDLAREGKKC